MANTVRLPRGKTPTRPSARPVARIGGPSFPTSRRPMASNTRSRTAAAAADATGPTISAGSTRVPSGSYAPGFNVPPSHGRSQPSTPIAQRKSPVKLVSNPYSPPGSARSQATTQASSTPSSMSSGSPKRPSPQAVSRNVRRLLNVGAIDLTNATAPMTGVVSSLSPSEKLTAYLKKNPFDKKAPLDEDFDIEDIDFRKVEQVLSAYHHAFPDKLLPSTYNQVLTDTVMHPTYRPSDLRTIVSRDVPRCTRVPTDRKGLVAVYLDTYLDNLTLAMDVPTNVDIYGYSQ